MSHTVHRWLLGGVLVAMAAGQLSDLAGFVAILDTYRVVPGGMLWAFALALVAAQLVAGIGLIFGGRSRRAGAAWMAVLVSVVWTVLAVQAFGGGLDLDNCGCFGVHLAQPLRWWVLVQDAVFVASAAWAVVMTRRLRGVPADAGTRRARVGG